MEVKKILSAFGKKKFYIYEDGKKCIDFSFDYAESVPGSQGQLIKIAHKSKWDCVDKSISSQSKSVTLRGIIYDNCYDFGDFLFLQEKDGHNLKIVDKKTTKDIIVANGFLYAFQSDRFIVYHDWSNEYRAVLNTSQGMDTYTLPDMRTNYCVQNLFDFVGDYLNNARLIADLENPRRVYKIMRDFLKRLLQEDIANFDKDTKKYYVPEYDRANVVLRAVKYSTPEEAKEEANAVLKHFDNAVLIAIERVEEKQKIKQASAIEEQKEKEQREIDIQTALDDFNAEKNTNIGF